MTPAAAIERALAAHGPDHLDLDIGVWYHGERHRLSTGTPGGIYRVASISKVFTGTAFAHGLARGELRGEDEAQAYLSSPLPTWSGEPIRLVHLATHTSGLGPADVDDLDSLDALVRGLGTVSLPSRPGSAWAYSNVGMGLLGNLIGLAAGTTFDHVVAERMCAPLGLVDTTLDLTAAQSRRLRAGHDETFSPVRTPTIPILAGSGGFYSTVDDLLTLLAAQLSVGPDDPGAVAARPWFDRDPGGMGLGWMIDPLPATSATVTWHNGSLPGYRAYVGYVAGAGCAVAVLTNTARAVDDLGRDLLRDLVE